MSAPPYAELHCVSNFSFLRGASSADELFARARQLGYAALAITDECSLAGIVRALEASEAQGLPLIVGSEIRFEEGPKLVLLCETQDGYARLCELITRGRRAADKGRYRLQLEALEAIGSNGLLALWPSPRVTDLRRLQALFPHRLWLAVELHRTGDDAERLAALQRLGATHGLPLVACGDVHMHVRRRRALQDALTAIRLNTTVAAAGHALFPNGERHLRTREALAALYPAALMEESVRIAERCRFSLRELKYDYPRELVPAGLTPTQHLRELTEAGALRRWPQGIPAEARALIEKELALIAELRYEAFFLTVHDIVTWASSQGILCQGRGSAVNSVVCYCLDITAIGPDRISMLFERFVSKARREPPDIDVDFEHERREEVIQYIYRRYGRERAALAATVICYRRRSAARDLGRALGFSEDQLEQLARVFDYGQGDIDRIALLREYGFDPDAPELRRFLVLLDELVGFPRHLSQHVGGFVIAEQPLWRLVPVENAAMPERTIIQWDKDDLETLGLLKVDCLALGMLSCLRRCLGLIEQHEGIRHTLATIPEGDPHTYAMIQRADTIGVFQIESRAQMAMLPRLKPACFYDLVIQVAIVRPGPIQGDMVHPYLRRRSGEEKVEYASKEVEDVLRRTLGIPIFQEQVMRLMVVAAGFTPDEADQLRRSMAAWKRRGDLGHWYARIVGGMLANGYTREFAERLFQQIKGFGEYGFPESHAASFALLAYASSWLRCHHPAAYACALLNAQPMGFYAPAQIIQDVQRHGVPVRPADVLVSEWDCTLEAAGRGKSALALRLGLRQIRGLSEPCAQRIVAARQQRSFADTADLIARARLTRDERETLAAAGALRRLAGHRHRAFWAVAGAEAPAALLAHTRLPEERVSLPLPSRAADLFADYASQGFSLGDHPLRLVRPRLQAQRYRPASALPGIRDGAPVRVAGLVTQRQRPQTAQGVTFVTLEDETGSVNLVVWRQLAERQRRELLESRLLGVHGVLQQQAGVIHVVAGRLHDLSAWLAGLDARSRDFR